MAAAEAATDPLGPRFAPDDPTLPHPWKGLIDGSTGLLYFWNQETNVTQYERPASGASPLLAGSIPSDPTSVPVNPQNNSSSGTIAQQQPSQQAGQSGQQVHQEQSSQALYQVPHQQMPFQQQQQQYPNMQFQQMSYQQGGVPYMQPQPRGPQYQLPPHGSYQQQPPGYWGPPYQQQQQEPPLNLKPQQGPQINTPQTLFPKPDDSNKTPKLNALPVAGPHGSVPQNQQFGYQQQQMGGFGGPRQPGLSPVRPPFQGPPQEMRSGPPFGLPGQTGGGFNHMAPNPTLYSNGTFPHATNPNPRPPHSRMFGPPSDFSEMSPADAYRQHHEVTATGENVPAPFMTFESTGFPPEILREIHLAGFTSPTPIQAQTWPVALQNQDIVAIAKTGSGKTLGYLIPAFVHLKRCRNNPVMGPTVLVLAPTRELATQIQDEAIKFGHSSRISCTCLYGGAPKGPQLKELERGADIVVATPGRLNDILDTRKISLRQVSFLVLDEADRMLDMGFEPQIRKIVTEVPPRRQTLMYTATWPKEVRKIAGDLLQNPVQVNIGSVELAANKSITQYVEVVPQMEKQRRLEQILRAQERGSRIIIFCSTKRLCDQLARSISRTFGAAAIHGDKSQGERDHVLQQFRSGRAPVLVATDVAARGLDIKDIRVVINYDFPTGIEDYVHRIGRTGRAGATGISYTFFSDQDWKYAGDLIKLLEGASQHVPTQLRDMAARGPAARGPPSHRNSGGPAGGMSRWDSNGGGRAEFGGRGGRGGGGPPSGGFGGRGGGRGDFQGGRGRGGFRGGASGGRGGGRYERGPQDRYDGRRGYVDSRGRDRSLSPSPDRGRSRGYDRSRSRSRSWSQSRSCSPSRSWSRSQTRSPSQSPGRSYDGYKRRRASGFDVQPVSNGPDPTGPTPVPAPLENESIAEPISNQDQPSDI